jgi:hypothetical protein
MNPNLTNPEIAARLACEREQDLRRASQPNPTVERRQDDTVSKGRSLRSFFFSFYSKK